MDQPASLGDLRTMLGALAMTQPRIVAMFMVLPVFNKQIIPGTMRLAVASVFGMIIAPTLVPETLTISLGIGTLVFLGLKEAFVGFVMGMLIAIPFWIFEAVGFFIDNQRGATIGATLNPLTGNDSSQLGALFNQAFIVVFMISGGFLIMLDALYRSFELWNPYTWYPRFPADAIPLYLEQLDRLVLSAVLLGSPVIVAMFLAELGLALVSRFVPQLQVFFMAMPIKSGLAVLVLILYMATMFEYGMDHIAEMKKVVSFMDAHFK